MTRNGRTKYLAGSVETKKNELMRSVHARSRHADWRSFKLSPPWRVVSLRSLLSPHAERGRPELQLLSVVRESGVIVRDTEDSSENRNYIPDELSNYKVVRPAQFVLNKMKAWQGSYGISKYLGIVSPAYFVFNVRSVQPEFFHWAIRSTAYVPHFARVSDGVRIAQWDLSVHGMRDIPFAIPPLEEQNAIVRFVDDLDTRLRQVISEKNRLARILWEARQVVVERAVTRGLDRDVRLRTSEIPWIGDVPEHWGIVRLRSHAAVRVSNVDKYSRGDQRAVRLCNYVDVYYNDFITSEMPFMRATASTAEIERFGLVHGDVLITKDSEAWNDIGVPALVSDTSPDFVSGYHLAILRPHRDRLLGEYLLRVLQSRVAHQFHVAAKGVTRYGLSYSDIKSVRFPVPPLREQEAIVRHLDQATADFDAALAGVRREIELLKEYRARLIADVVTGRLDVREVAGSLPGPNEEGA